ncbi:sensitive to high expression protein 9, mitochondrial [Purpureocillium lavendulum]|uniref:Sensitive to high expression protein 9, mitochondrial n=1 Tax=Purpureocillium lavendulum TaxID=1247861 RepID=A0AB34G652_9HYPO|nr:sensitive to high expression protein 9, mitochondrial [Purpureocillium lavendulum]
MQPFGRPVARAAWAHGRRLLLTNRTAFATPAAAATADALGPHKAFGRLCGVSTTIASRARLYSTQPPPNDTEKARKGESEPTTPAPDPTPDTLPHASEAELPSSKDRRRSNLNQNFSQLMDNLQSRVLTASHTLNDITGYSSIEGIKAENESLETQLADAQSRVRAARQAYKTSNTKRATTQREVTTLLARKDSWSPHDLERFTELYRADHVLEGEVAGAQESLTEAEADEQSLSQRLNAGILKRYHEEQIWSDRIRRASTWGTWGLMGMNFLLFVVLQFVAEPWKRRRLVKGVVAEEKVVLEEVRGELEAVKLSLAKNEDDRQRRQLERQQALELSSAAIAAQPGASGAGEMAPQGTWREILLDPGRWQTVIQDLCSERRIDLRMKDASVLALEAALAGAAVAGSVALLLVRRT